MTYKIFYLTIQIGDLVVAEFQMLRNMINDLYA